MPEKKFLLTLDNCNHCGDLVKNLGERVTNGEITVGSVNDPEFMEKAKRLELNEFPTMISESADDSLCILDDDDYTKTVKCVRSKSPKRPNKPAGVEI